MRLELEQVPGLLIYIPIALLVLWGLSLVTMRCPACESDPSQINPLDFIDPPLGVPLPLSPYSDSGLTLVWLWVLVASPVTKHNFVNKINGRDR